jgi:hypothetical protein
MAWEYYFAAGGSAAQPAYEQFDYNGAAVGCGPVALTMLFCWGDYQASHGNSYWAGRTGLYRKDGGRGADAVAPLTQDIGVMNVIKEIHGQVKTFAILGQGATCPWDMQNANQYLAGRTNTTLSCAYNPAGFAQDGIRNRAIASIRDRDTPAVIGIGWLNHYPLAFGYSRRTRTIWYGIPHYSLKDTIVDRRFHVNQGHGAGGDSEAIDAETWFSGEIHP